VSPYHRWYVQIIYRRTGPCHRGSIDAGKEFIVAYVSRRLLDAETRYAFVEKLCLSLYYACSKFRHYILSSHCIVMCQHNVVRCMMQRPILSGRMGKWVYSLVEYELSYESLKAVKGQVVADFIVDHGVEMDDACTITVTPWKLFFDGSVCANGCGIGCLIVSPNGVAYDFSARLEFTCTNNQTEYEALLMGLSYLIDIRVKNVKVFGDSNLVVQQVNRESQCLDGVLSGYLSRCAQLVAELETFNIEHVRREHNTKANQLAQQASGYRVK
jgi:ribonuclease HI